MDPEATYTCPVCGAVSHNANDVARRYCGRCHRFGDDPAQPSTPDEQMTKTERELLLKLTEIVAGLACERDMLRARRPNTTTTADGAVFANEIMDMAEIVRLQRQ